MNALLALAGAGWLTAAAAILLAAETLVLLLLRRPAGRPGLILPNAAAGLCLIGAVHAALAGWGAIWVLLFLALALPAHLLDLAFRLR